MLGSARLLALHDLRGHHHISTMRLQTLFYVIVPQRGQTRFGLSPQRHPRELLGCTVYKFSRLLHDDRFTFSVATKIYGSHQNEKADYNHIKSSVQHSTFTNFSLTSIYSRWPETAFQFHQSECTPNTQPARGCCPSDASLIASYLYYIMLKETTEDRLFQDDDIQEKSILPRR